MDDCFHNIYTLLRHQNNLIIIPMLGLGEVGGDVPGEVVENVILIVSQSARTRVTPIKWDHYYNNSYCFML